MLPEPPPLTGEQEALVLAIAEHLSRRGFGAPASRYFANQYVRRGINEAIANFILAIEASAYDAKAEKHNRQVMDQVWSNLKSEKK